MPAQARTHNSLLEIPLLGLRHGFFTDRYIFRHILGQENRNSTMSMIAFEV